MKKITVLILILSALASLCTAVNAESELVLISKGKDITSSGYTFNSPAERVVDGNVNSLWSSNDSGNIWVTVDLGEGYNIARVDVYPRMDMDQPSSRGNFSIQLSNDKDFSESVTILTIGEQAHKTPARAVPQTDEEYRYVRVFKQSGYLCLGEIMVFTDPNKKSDKIKNFNYKDLTEEELNKVNLLAALGCVAFESEDDAFMPEKEITRAEFIYMLMHAVHNYISVSNEEYYDDYGANFAKAEIDTAVINGYITRGDSFLPDEAMTWDLALKLSAKVMGYDMEIRRIGASTVDYISKANDENLLKGLKYHIGSMTRAEATRLIYNILFAYPVYYTDNTVKDSDKCILELIHGIFYTEGIVTANRITNINFNKVMSEDHIMIDDEVYSFAKGLEADENIIGYKVRAYHDEENRIINIVPYKEQEVVYLDNTDYPKYKNGKYVVDSKKNKGNYTLSGLLNVIYNGKAAIITDEEKYVPAEGSITLIDHDGDNVFDVVKILDFKNNLASNINPEDEYITLQFGDEKLIDFSDAEYDIYKDGKRVKLSAVKQDDVLSIAESMDKEYYIIYIGKGKIEGTIESLSEDEVVISERDEPLRIASDFHNREFMEAGSQGTIYIDYFNNAVYYEYSNSGNLRYAFIYSMRCGVDDGEEKIFIKLFNTTGKGTYTVTAKTKIGGTRYKNINDRYDILEEQLFENGKIVPQMVRYKADYDLNIMELYTVKQSENHDENPDKTIKLLGGNPAGSTNGWYVADILAGRYVTNSDTVIFDVYYDGDDYECTVRPIKYFTQLSSRYVSYSAAYGTDEYEPVDVILKYSNPTSSDAEATYMMFNNVSMVVDDDDSVQYLVCGYSSGRKVEYMTAKQSVVDRLDLKKGMIIKCITRNGKVSGITVTYDPQSGLKEGFNNITQTDDVYNDNNNSFLQADVKKLNNGLVVLERDGKPYMFWGNSIGGICLYDSDKDKIIIMSANELRAKDEMPESYHKTVSHVKNGYIRNMFVYR